MLEPPRYESLSFPRVQSNVYGGFFFQNNDWFFLQLNFFLLPLSQLNSVCDDFSYPPGYNDYYNDDDNDNNIVYSSSNDNNGNLDDDNDNNINLPSQTATM